MTTPTLLPVAGASSNPIEGLRAGDMHPVAIGVPIWQLQPEAEGGLVVCRLNGEWLLREFWDERTQFGDVIEWHIQPQGREGVRILLAIAIVVASIFPVLAPAIPYLIAASVAYNILVPPRGPSAPTQAPAAGSVYSTSLAGNAARLDQPIWKSCGRIKITPPFAAIPYTEFKPQIATVPYGDSDQFYYAIFCVGIGDHSIERVFIGATSITHFSDVLIANYLPPGTQPARAQANVYSAPEVANLELDTGVYRGAFACCRPGDRATSIGIDVGANQGLGRWPDPLSVIWQIEYREIDDYGHPLGDFAILDSPTRTADTNTAQRWTEKYLLPRPMRIEVRLVRVDDKNTAPDARHAIQWITMRAYLANVAPLNPHAAHFEVVMRASEQLTDQTQRDFSMIAQCFARPWHRALGGWQAAAYTRNAAWWMLDLLSSTTWGHGLPDSRIDLDGFEALAAVLDARQDRFDYSFTSSTDVWSALQMIAHSCRCRIFRRNGVYTVARDELNDLPVTAFSARNTQPRSMKMQTMLPKHERPDGYVVQYMSNITWDTATVETPCPGFSAVEPLSPQYNAALPPMANPIYLGLDGVTGAKHATREGLYQAASLAYRQTSASCKVEMEGVLVAFMDPVRWQPQIHGYGQTGDVAFYDPITLNLSLSEKPDFSVGPLYLTLMRDDGSLTAPALVTSGLGDNDVTLPAAPDFALVLDDGQRERPKFLLGPMTTSDELVKITAIRDGGKTSDGAQLYDVEAQVDDDRVHAADNALLPGPGEIQDPPDPMLDDGSGGGVIRAVLPRVGLHVFEDTSGDADGTRQTYTLSPDGSFVWQSVYVPTATVLSGGAYAGEWTGAAIDPAQAALFEVRISIAGDNPPGFCSLLGGDAFGAWLNLGTARTIVTDMNHFGPGPYNIGTGDLTIEIRRVGGTIVQTSGSLHANVGYQPFEGGEGI